MCCIMLANLKGVFTISVMPNSSRALMGIEIAGSGAALPGGPVDNETLIQRSGLDSSPEWIEKRCGIKNRYFVESDADANSRLSSMAGCIALKRAGLWPPELDSLILATTTPDQQVPATAPSVTHRLGIDGTPAFDINAACSGFVFGINAAYERVYCRDDCSMVVGTDILSRVIDWQDRSTAILLGDGSGAVVLQRTERRGAGLLGSHEYANGSQRDLLYCKRGEKLNMEGQEVYKEMVKLVPEIGRIALEKAGISSTDLDLVIPHQANRRIIESVARKMGVSMDKMVWTGDEHANTSSASIPLALNQAIESHQIKRGDIIMLLGFGAGTTAAASVICY